MALEAGTKLGRYEIRSKIGAGGMGDVYLAQDTELDRTVAVKILPDDVTGDEQRLHRFTQEARAVSALNHPNILTIHKIGSSENIRFIATEFIDGQTLRRSIESGLKLIDILDIAIQAGSALARPTPRESFTATSSQTTSWCAVMVTLSCWILAWPN